MPRACLRCEGRGLLRHNTTKKDGKYLLGFISCFCAKGKKIAAERAKNAEQPNKQRSNFMNLKCYEYEWNFNETNGSLTCKRHGLEWRDATGDGAVLALLQVACELQEKLECAKNTEGGSN